MLSNDKKFRYILSGVLKRSLKSRHKFSNDPITCIRFCHFFHVSFPGCSIEYGVASPILLYLY